MVAIIYAHPYERDERLRRLGVTRDELIDIVRECVARRADTTDDDPQSAAGQFAWIYGTRRMRQLLRPKGLEKEILNGVETVADRKRKIRFAVISTDAGTANPDISPRNRTHKGPASERIADLNNQIELPLVDRAGNPISRKEDGDGYTLWYLCVFDDGSDVRAELSNPIDFKSGYFVKFSERIFILGPGEWEKVIVTNPDEDSGDSLTIDVRRK